MDALNMSLQVAHSIFKTVAGQSFCNASLKRKVMAAQLVILYNCFRYPWLGHIICKIETGLLGS